MDTRDLFDEILKRDRFLFIAEISNNHLGDFDRYKKLVLEAKASGAHAVKIQTFTADSLCLEVTRSRHLITSGVWKGRSYWDLYKSLEVPLDWSLRIRDFAAQQNIPIFSSPFSAKDLLFLYENDFDFFKIASAEIHSPELFYEIVNTSTPFIASLGFSSNTELNWISNFLIQNNCSHLMWGLLNCISNYPCSVSDLDIYKFFIAKNYVQNIGLSDHSIDSSNIVLSYILGARIFEKHLTLSRDDGGPDCSFSLEPSEMAYQISSIHELCLNPMLDNLNLSMSADLSATKPSLNFSRSVYAKRCISKGELLTLDNIGTYRPSHSESGISLCTLLGSKATYDIQVGHPILTSDIFSPQ